MMAALCRNILEFLKIDFWLTFKSSLLLTILYLVFIPVIRGISNLDSIRSAQCLSQSVALVGVLMVVPITRRELDAGIKEIIDTKAWSYLRSVMIRLICSFVLLSCLITGFALIMQMKNCVFPFGEFVIATICYAGFLGTMGLIFAQIGNNVIAGYLSALGYWTLCQLQIIREGDVLYLFPVIEGKIEMQQLIGLLLILMTLTGSVVFLIGHFNLSKTNLR